jgi:hypothetical protein
MSQLDSFQLLANHILWYIDELFHWILRENKAELRKAPLQCVNLGLGDGEPGVFSGPPSS